MMVGVGYVLTEGGRVDSPRNPPICLDHLNLNAYIDAMYYNGKYS
jgi:hypothetical protein